MACHAKRVVNLLQQELQRTQAQYQIVNASISGETTIGGLRRFSRTLRQHQPAIVILELGANDGLRGIATQDIEANLREMIKQSQKIRAKVLLLGMQLPPNYGGGYTARFKGLYPMLAKKYQVELVPYMLEGVLPNEFQADNLHPTAAAQDKILKTILEKLKLMLANSS